MKKIRAKLYSFVMKSKISKRDYFYPVHYGGQFITNFFKNQDEFYGYFEDILMWLYMTPERYFRTLCFHIHFHQPALISLCKYLGQGSLRIQKEKKKKLNI